MIEAGKQAVVKGTVLRVDGERVDLQTPSGQLIQTNIKNVESVSEPEVVVTGSTKQDAKQKGKSRGPVGYATR